MLELSAGRLRLTVDPERGGLVRSFDVLIASGWKPVLVSARGELRDAGQSALFPMAPFANRVRDNRLTVGGREIDLMPNTGDPLCLHGWAWQRPWHVAHVAPDHCRLTLRLREHGYDLRLRYDMQLTHSDLTLTLGAVNEGAETVPVGLGFHPYFPRLPDTMLRFVARSYWPEGPGYLPTGHDTLPDTADYAQGRHLPSAWRNNCYSGWTGSADISQPSLGYDLTFTATGATVLMFYVDPALDRFAVEPQTHVSGETHTGPNGLTALRPKHECRIEMTLSVYAHSAGPLPEGSEIEAT